MAQVITCPTCRKQYPLKPEMLGKTAKCKCGTKIKIPKPAEDVLTEADLLDEPAAPKRPAPVKSAPSMLKDDSSSETLTEDDLLEPLVKPERVAAPPAPAPVPDTLTEADLLEPATASSPDADVLTEADLLETSPPPAPRRTAPAVPAAPTAPARRGALPPMPGAYDPAADYDLAPTLPDGPVSTDEETCANCQTPLPPGAVLCTRCGYNQKTRTVVNSSAIRARSGAAPASRTTLTGTHPAKATTCEQAVDRNEGMRALKRFFSDYWDALEFYAQRRQGTYSARNAPSDCELCKKPAQEVRKFVWSCTKSRRADMDGLTTAVNVISVVSVLAGGPGRFSTGRRESKTFRFDTYHCVCPTCWKRHHTEIMIRNWVPWGLFLAVFAMAMATMYFLFENLIVGVLIAFLAAIIPTLIFRSILSLIIGTPKQLKFMRGGEFRLEKSKGMD